MTYLDFVRLNRIRAFSEWIDKNPNAPNWGNAYHFKTRLRRGNKQMTVYFSKGYALSGEPGAGEVLCCLASDSAGVENAASFEEWAREYGYSEDSREAERLFHVCERQAARLRAFLGDELYQNLLWKVGEA